MAEQRVPQLVLLAELVEQITLALLHLELELADVVLLELHLPAHLYKGRFGVLFHTGAVDVDLLGAVLALALRVGELDLDVDGAALDGQEANEDVTGLENLGLLVVSVDEEDVLREVRCVASTFLRLLLFLRDVYAQVLVCATRYLAVPAGARVIAGGRCCTSTVPSTFVEGDCELGRRVGVLGRHSESHQVLGDYLDAVGLAFVNDCMTII